MKRFLKLYRQQTQDGWAKLPLELAEVDILDKMIGRSRSAVERKLRHAIVWTAGVFAVFDRVYPKTALQYKAALLQQRKE